MNKIKELTEEEIQQGYNIIQERLKEEEKDKKDIESYNRYIKGQFWKFTMFGEKDRTVPKNKNHYLSRPEHLGIVANTIFKESNHIKMYFEDFSFGLKSNNYATNQVIGALREFMMFRKKNTLEILINDDSEKIEFNELNSFLKNIPYDFKNVKISQTKGHLTSNEDGIETKHYFIIGDSDKIVMSIDSTRYIANFNDSNYVGNLRTHFRDMFDNGKILDKFPVNSEFEPELVSIIKQIKTVYKKANDKFHALTDW